MEFKSWSSTLQNTGNNVNIQTKAFEMFLFLLWPSSIINIKPDWMSECEIFYKK